MTVEMKGQVVAASARLPALAEVVPAEPENFNAALRAHACTHPEWELRQLVAVLHGWAERFNVHFGLQLTPPAITIQPLAGKYLGRYRPAPNGFGIEDEVAIDHRHARRPLGEVLNTLLHEMLHQWQHHHGCPSRSAHDLQFRRKCLELGIPCSEEGVSQGVVADSPFVRLLQAYDIAVQTGTVEIPPEAKPRPKFVSWCCSCTTVRCDTDLVARCERCGQPFLRAVRASRG